jgi:hypothetical protein
MGLHLLIFFSSIVNMPETKWSAHCSYTLPVYLFVEIENVYGAIIGVTIFQSFVRLWQGEANPLTRVRWSLLSVLAFFGTTLYLLCTASCTVDYFARDHVLAKSLGFAALVLRCAVSLMWPLVILPNHVYLALGKPLVILGKARTLRALLLTRAAIGHVADSMCPPTTCAKHQTGFWQSLRDLDFYIYQAVVSILDGVRTIKLSLEQGEGCECLEIVRVAELVCYLMEGITDDVEYGDLIAACIETGRQLKTKPRRRSAPALRAA